MARLLPAMNTDWTCTIGSLHGRLIACVVVPVRDRQRIFQSPEFTGRRIEG
ncbi:hypothetical protein BaRGS_00017600, partial [Batillaria attramentaria]